MNTTEGGLHFEAGIDTNAWDEDISKIRKDAEQIMQEIQKQAGLLDNAFDKLSGGAAGVEEVLKKAGISFEQLVSGNMLENLKAANLEFGKTGAELRQAAADADKFVTGMEEGLKSAIEQQKAALEAIAQMPEGPAKMTALSEFAEITKDIQSSTDVIARFKEFVAEVQEQAKSLPQKFSEVREEMEQMAMAGTANSDRYRELEAEAIRLKSIQKDINEEISKGVEPPKELTIGQQIAEATRELEKMRAAGQENTEMYQQVQAEAVRLKNIQQGVAEELRKATTPPKELTVAQQFSHAKDEMEKLVASGQHVSDRYRELAAEATRLKEAQAQVNQELSAMSEPPGLEGLISGMTFATASLGLMQGAMSLFGGENEKLNETMGRLQALMSVTIGLQELQKQATEEGAFAINVIAKAKEWWAAASARTAFSVGGLTVSVGALTAALTLGLTLAIGAVIYILDQWNDKQKEIAEQSQKLSSAIADSVAEPLLAYRKLQMQWNALADDMEAKKKFITDHKDEFEKLNIVVDNTSDAENIFVKNSAAFVEAMMLRAEATAHAQVAIEDFKEAFREEREYRRKYIEGDMTLWEKAQYYANNGVVGMRTDAMHVQKKKQDGINEQQKTLELEKKAQEISRANGFKTRDKDDKNTEISKPKRTPVARTKKEVVEEYLPEGSVAEIQKRLGEIDKALSKATNNDQINALKQKRIATAAELAEAEKRVAVRSFEEQQEYVRKQYELRDQLLDQMVDPEQVDRLFPDIKGKNYGDYLKATASGLRALVESGEGTEETARNLGEMLKKLDEWEGNKSAVEIFTERLEALKQQFSGGELIAEIDKLTKGQVREDGIARNEIEKLAKKAKEDEIKTQQDKFRQILEEQKTFQEKSEDLRKEYEAAMALATTDDQRAKVNRAFSKRGTDLFFEAMQGSEEWTKVFTDMNQVATGKLEEFKEILKQKLTEAKTIEEKIKIGEFIKKLDETISSRNFIPDFSKMIKALGDSSLSTAEKIKIAHEEIAKFQEQLRYASEVASGVSDIFTQLGWDMDSAFGDALNSIQQTIAGLQAVAEGAGQAIEGFASGNILQGVAGTVKAIGGAIKAVAAWANGDAKKERNIKRQAAALKELETAYNSLAFAAERAFGSMKYEGQRDLIRNLEQQKAVIQGMLNTESSKKKGDKEKMAGYQQQIQQINQSIASIKEGIIKDVLQTDIPDAASKVGDALVDAFGRGEDAVKSLENAAQDMIKNLLRNQLNLALQSKMKPILDNLLNASGFKADGTGSFTGLTPEQIAAFKAQVVAAGQGMQGFLDGYKEIFGNLDPTQAQGLKGDIKAVTEKTAGALEAQINAMRENQVAGMEVMRNSLLQLTQIEVNTRNLIQIRQDISELNRKTKNQLAGVP